MTASASKEALQALHKALADVLRERIGSPDATAADLGVARQFLRDNGIDAVAPKDSPLARLRDALPFPDADSIAADDTLYN